MRGADLPAVGLCGVSDDPRSPGGALTASALFLIGCGTIAIVQAAMGELLPHDSAYLGLSASQLCALNDCRILHFMVHDRISFGGVLIAIGVMYLWLTRHPLAQGESWAWWTVALSAAAGFLSFLTYLGYGYLDTLHGLGTLALLPVFATGLFRSRRLRRPSHDAASADPRSAAAIGRTLLLVVSAGIAAAGGTIAVVGMTRVFVPQDLEFLGLSREALDAINPRFVPLIAHDRAGFGGALVSFGIAMFGCLWWSRPSRALSKALAIAGSAGFGSAVGGHHAIGYTSLMHLGPAVLGCFMFGLGVAIISRPRDHLARVTITGAREIRRPRG